MKVTFGEVKEASPCHCSYRELIEKFGKGQSGDALDTTTFLLEEALYAMDEEDITWALDNVIPKWKMCYVNLLMYEKVKHFLIPELNEKQLTLLNKSIATIWGVVYRKGDLSDSKQSELEEEFSDVIYYPVNRKPSVEHSLYCVLRFVNLVLDLDGEAVERLEWNGFDWVPLLRETLTKID